MLPKLTFEYIEGITANIIILVERIQMRNVIFFIKLKDSFWIYYCNFVKLNYMKFDKFNELINYSKNLKICKILLET